MTTPTDTPRTLTLEEMAEEYARWHSSVICMERAIAPHFLAGARAALSLAEVREMRNAFYYFLGIAPVQASGWLRAEKALIAFDQLMEGVE